MSELVDFLERHREDRGAMAALRCALVPAKEMRAWPYLSAFGGIGGGHEAEVVRTVAGLYAVCHSADFPKMRTLGLVCRSLCADDEDPDAFATDPRDEAAKPGPMARRFAHLLEADRDEICRRSIRVVVYAKSKGIGVDYAQLEQDLRGWPAAREVWARDFWTRPQKSEGEDAK